MATPRPIEKYPKQYLNIFRHGAVRDFEIASASEREARRLRAYLYAVREALLENRSFDPELASVIRDVSLRIRGRILLIGPSPRGTLNAPAIPDLPA